MPPAMGRPGAGGPPPLRPGMGGPGAGPRPAAIAVVGVDLGLGNPIPLASTKKADLDKFKADMGATIAVHAPGIQALLNANTNRALEVQNALAALVSAGAPMFNANEVLAASYAVLTAPAGTTNKMIRDRASNLLTLDVPKSIAVNAALKIIFP